MIKWNPIFSLLIAGAGLTSQVQAQEPGKGKKDEQIIIHKKGKANEKLTIVVDGDAITVNGKPLNDFSSDSIDVRVLKGNMARSFRLNGRPEAITMLRSRPGGVHQLNKLPFHPGLSNGAFLGVLTEGSDKGAVIKEVTKESAAEKAGLQKGDVITRIGDSVVTSSEDLYKAVGKYKPEDKITVTYLRDGKTATAKATLGKSEHMRTFRFNDEMGFEGFPELKTFPLAPDVFPPAMNFSRQPRLGLQIQDLEDSKGVKVLDASPESPATKAGVQKDDIITGINGTEVHSVDDIRGQLRDIKEGDIVKIELKRNDKRRTVEIKFPRKLKTTTL